MNVLLTLLFIFTSIIGAAYQLPIFAATDSSSNSVEITGTVPGCGDGMIQSGESCDGSDLNGQSCSTQGFSGGTISCNSDCTFNTSQCTSAPPGGGGGGGGFFIPPTLPKKPEPKPVLPTGDFNADGLINFRDLSIMLYWFGKTGTEASRSDLNGDGQITFVDVSILLYRWKDDYA